MKFCFFLEGRRERGYVFHQPSLNYSADVYKYKADLRIDGGEGRREPAVKGRKERGGETNKSTGL